MPGRPRGVRTLSRISGRRARATHRTTHALAIGNDQARDEHIPPLERFFRGNPEILAGERAIRAYENTDSGLGGYIEVARREGAEIVLPVAAESWPSGPASAETHERLCRLVLDEVERGGFDAILLDLHGAMVAEGVEDAEGDRCAACARSIRRRRWR